MNASLPRQDRRERVSIVICCQTDARWWTLCEAITTADELGADELVVVVDHNPALRKRLVGAFPTLRAVDNGGPRGLSDARNSGVAATTGEIVVFLDENAIAEPALADVFRAVLNSDERVLGVVAAIRPGWPGTPPAWFPDEFLWVIGCTHRGLGIGPVSDLLGAAMAIRRSVIASVGGFSSGLGRTPGRLPLGWEETELCVGARRARPDGLFLHEPLAVCRHHVTPDRTTWRYFVGGCFAQGWATARLAALAPFDPLTSERRSSVRDVLPRAVLSNLTRAARGEGKGLARAFAVCLGLAAILVGYGVGRGLMVWAARVGVTPASRPADPARP